ncbi:hypothetical protein HPB52_022879 [Rhipicephalus sanguineus]|uniref:Uncharacterized protein n=1 Tax=Rhipicephalus sanguineus TaxID=34632 RepID=A0A9D4Q3P1_RHISA|nr:hypothetical protein HPB52_022879 [Rhipicephalus sanguineus]
MVVPSTPSFSPSLGHAKRMLKILRAELYRQIRLHRIHLGVLLQNSFESSVAGFQLRRYLQLAGQATEALWLPQLRYLRERATRDRRKAGGKVHVPEDLHLPDDVIQVLGLGPKFGVQKQRTNPELLTVVRQMSRRATEGLDPLEVTVGWPSEGQAGHRLSCLEEAVGRLDSELDKLTTCGNADDQPRGSRSAPQSRRSEHTDSLRQSCWYHRRSALFVVRN